MRPPLDRSHPAQLFRPFPLTSLHSRTMMTTPPLRLIPRALAMMARDSGGARGYLGAARDAGHMSGAYGPSTQNLRAPTRPGMGFECRISLGARRRRAEGSSSLEVPPASPTSTPAGVEDLPLAQRITCLRGRTYDEGTPAAKSALTPAATRSLTTASALATTAGEGRRGDATAARITTGSGRRGKGLTRSNPVVGRGDEGTTPTGTSASKRRAKREAEARSAERVPDGAEATGRSGSTARDSPGSGSGSGSPTLPCIIDPPLWPFFGDPADPSCVWQPCGVDMTTSKEAKKWFPQAMLKVRVESKHEWRGNERGRSDHMPYARVSITHCAHTSHCRIQHLRSRCYAEAYECRIPDITAGRYGLSDLYQVYLDMFPGPKIVASVLLLLQAQARPPLWTPGVVFLPEATCGALEDDRPHA